MSSCSVSRMKPILAILSARQSRSVHVLDLPRHSKSTQARGRPQWHPAFAQPASVAGSLLGFGAIVSATVNGRQYNVGIIEHFWCAPYVDQLRASCRKLVVDLVDVESLWHQRMAGTKFGGRSCGPSEVCRAPIADLETKLLPRFDEVLVTSPADANFMLALMSHFQPVLRIPKRLAYRPRAGQGRSRKFSIVFSGNLEYQPNICGVRYLQK